MVHRARKGHAGGRVLPVPNVVVFDPDDAWQAWADVLGPVYSRRLTPWCAEDEEPVCQVRRVRTATPRDVDILVCVVPPEGFSGSQWRKLHEARRKHDPIVLYVATVAPEQLVGTGRSEPGYVSLVDEVARQSGGHLVALLLKSRVWVRSFKRHILAIAEGVLVDWRKEHAGEGPGDAHVRGPLSAWAAFARKARQACARRRTQERAWGPGARAMAEDLTRLQEALERELDEWESGDVPAPLECWIERTRIALSRAGQRLPVVGRFSSGKTTFFNSVLGLTSDGLPPLRTDQTHNTAILSRFHPVEPGGSSRVVFTWKEAIRSLTLLGPACATPAAVSPVSGVISRIRSAGDGARLVTIRARNGVDHFVLVGDRLALKPGMLVGAHVRTGQAISTGTPRSSLRRCIIKGSDSAFVECHAHATRAMIAFLRSGVLCNGVLEIELRRGDLLGGGEIVSETVHQGSGEWHPWLDYLETLANRFGAKTTGTQPLDIPPGERFPIEVRLDADVRRSRTMISGHDLQGAADWDWFQGRSGDESTRRISGFAESDACAFLLQSADLYLDNPLFQYVAMVDTPGLGSITAEHDATTEAEILDAQNFAVLCPLHKAHEVANVGVLRRVRLSLERRGVSSDLWPDRVFLVLNWFARRTRGVDRAERALRKFEALAAAVLGCQPRVYLVDLSRSASSDHDDRLIPGIPGLADLHHDLRDIVGGTGLSQRLSDTAGDLSRTLTTWDRSLRARRRELVGSDAGATVERLQTASDRLRADGSMVRELRAHVTEEVEICTAIATRIRDELEEKRLDKGSFEDLRDWLQPVMARYNEQRLRVGDELADTVQRRIRRALRRVDVDAEIDIQSTVPTSDLRAMPEQTALETINKVIADWPGAFKRFFNWLDNGLVWHGEKQRKRVKSDLMPDGRHGEIQTAFRKLERDLHSQIDAAAFSARVAVEQRLSVQRGSQREREAEEARLANEEAAMKRWTSKTRRMLERIKQLAALLA